jgi:hypothetical protein
MIFDISDPSSPTLVTSVIGGGRGLAIEGTYLYLIASNGLSIRTYDISDPMFPTEVGHLNLSMETLCEDIAVEGNYAYLALEFDGGLLVADVSDPSAPHIFSELQLPNTYSEKVVVEGNYAYLTTDDLYGPPYLLVIDVSDPTAISAAGGLGAPGAAPWLNGLAISGDYAYTFNSNSLLVADISDPTAPTWAGTGAGMSSVEDICISGDFLFAAGRPTITDEIVVYDISDPTTPTPIETSAIRDGDGRVVAEGEYAYVANGYGLEVFRVFDPKFMGGNVGRSVRVSQGSSLNVRARLSAAQTGDVRWQAIFWHGAYEWIDLPLDGSWTRVDPVGASVFWRSTHVSPRYGANPTCTLVTLEWLMEPAGIDAIVDVPDDQGGWVRLTAFRSGYDFADETEWPVTGYWIHQRVDDGAFRSTILTEGTVPTSPLPEHLLPESFDLQRVRQYEERTFVLGGRGTVGEMPPGVWEVVGSIPAMQQDTYTARIPTRADSTAEGGTAWSVHVVTTHTTTPSVWFASEPDSGYSVDNIAPGVPNGLAFDGPGTLEWDEADEEDFAYHSVYGSESETFDETATLIGYTVAPTYDVDGNTYGYYHVTTSDAAGNESDPATIQSPSTATPDDHATPTVLTLHAARPNPFRTGTAIGFDLPERCRVRVSIFDPTGQRIRTVVHGHRAPGRHHVSWDGTNDAGEGVAPGVYFARVLAGGLETSQRLVVVR